MFAAGAASAADLPRKAPAMVAPVPVFSWTGFYLGINGGYGWGSTRGDLLDPLFGGPGQFDVDGWLAGGQIGFNYQFPGSGFVIGLEADYQWASLEGDISVLGIVAARAELERFGTVRGRLGWAWDRFMIYGTGGWAFGGRVEASVPFGLLVVHSRDMSGWTAGAGIEWAFAPNWSAKLEYLHIEFDREPFFTGAPIFCVVACDAGLDVDIIRVGVNWRFGALFGIR
jgi:outer membrane immunogenic protein